MTADEPVEITNQRLDLKGIHNELRRAQQYITDSKSLPISVRNELNAGIEEVIFKAAQLMGELVFKHGSMGGRSSPGS